MLVDGGSSIGGSPVNINPLRIAQILGIRMEFFQPVMTNIVKFDGHAQTPLLKVAFQIAACPSDNDHLMEFHIAELDTTYNLLFGRPWIDSLNVVASSMHQCVWWSKRKKIFAAYVEGRQAWSSWPMILAPAYDNNVSLIQLLII